jgi:hypothetical protein
MPHCPICSTAMQDQQANAARIFYCNVHCIKAVTLAYTWQCKMYESNYFDYTTVNVSRLNYIEKLYKNNIKKTHGYLLSNITMQNYLLFRLSCSHSSDMTE